MRRIYRQGDVLVREVSTKEFSRRSGAEVATENGRIILARGEATGHNHSIDARMGRMFEDSRPGICYLLLDEPGLLEYQEHPPISLPKGVYEVIRQRECEPRQHRDVVEWPNHRINLDYNFDPVEFPDYLIGSGVPSDRQRS